MAQINSNAFITDNFLLQSKEAEVLYHQYAKDMPIIDYHNHLSAKEIAEDKPIGNITKAWLAGDHYKWRAMRANGVEETFITGPASLDEKFLKWAETVPYTLRNPLFHWTQLELKRYFGIDAILQLDTAKEIYEKANAVLASKTPAQLLKDMNVELVCTTDDPSDTLEYHKQIAKGNFFTKVLPTFRPDELFFIGQSRYVSYLKKLEACVAFSIDSLSDLLKAIDSRIAYFHDHGCRLSDYGIGDAIDFIEATEGEVTAVFDKFLKGVTLSNTEVNKYRSYLLLHLGKQYHKRNWVQQYHLGALRDNNSRLKEQVGADVGCDSIADYPWATAMSRLFNALDATDQLAKTVTYNLNPSQNEVFATMMGNFSEGGVPGKMQWGSGWWFLDQKDGIEKQLNTLSNMGLLSRFVGMLTDSRSFLSFPRHEYFRRILCNLIAEDINKRLVPNDMVFLGKMIQDICYNNAVNYFEFN
ncbi:glucuronate isomerase [Aestuariivivens insulae]|uniref:glucuronate isomerase n=1 Tax=Aestuariivivens insulae TaxID=1621988 RepID=UPI001F569F52|nr:glucuronate isomerase [Aestuariivivens insulae]